MELFSTAIGKNITIVHPPYFIISGFTGIPNIKYYYVFLFFVYIVSVLGNMTVMIIICLDHTLRTPKYIAVFNLAFADLLSSSAVVPKVLDIFLFDHPYIHFSDCLTFMFFCYACLSMQGLNLVALSYDRLIAIIFPLHYHVKVTHRFMFSLIAFFWLLVFIITLSAVGLLTRLSYCRSVVIENFVCDYYMVQNLACNDNTLNKVIGHFLPGIILWLPLIFILSLAAVKERMKAFKTCTSHLSLVAIYFLPIMVAVTMSASASIHPNTQEIKESVKKLLKISHVVLSFLCKHIWKWKSVKQN
uniref:G-protein coupled receptors family 1 profile domain-containing protein n=1 Tax=Monopterus albus TaxID=43700 RepID=A0A3Q3K5L3_MONAL